MKTTLFGLCLAVLFAASTACGTVLVSDDFEGGVVGDPAPAPWVDFGMGLGVVSDAFANSGTQSVNIAGDSTKQLGTDVAFDASADISLSFRENQGYMSFFVYVTNGGGDLVEGIGNQVYCRLLVDYWAGILTSNPGSTAWAPAVLAGGAAGGMTVGAFHDLDIDLDLENGTFDVYFNDNLVGDDLASWYTGAAPVDGTILRVYLQSTKTGGDGTFIDDFSITAPAVPEPATMSLIGMLVLGLLRKRG